MSVPESERKEGYEFLIDLLPKSQHRKVDEILDYFLDSGTPARIEVTSARVPVEQVEAYGLVLDVDANGRAAVIGLPQDARAEVTEWWQG